MGRRNRLSLFLHLHHTAVPKQASHQHGASSLYSSPNERSIQASCIVRHVFIHTRSIALQTRKCCFQSLFFFFFFFPHVPVYLHTCLIASTPPTQSPKHRCKHACMHNILPCIRNPSSSQPASSSPTTFIITPHSSSKSSHRRHQPCPTTEIHPCSFFVARARLLSFC
ncbi:hypothetical protein BC567DRAFT_65957 [Phyllosticta citribraziliensis]